MSKAARKEQVAGEPQTRAQRMAIVQKVQKLVALAQSDNEGEARNAAMKAVELMNEHELIPVCKEDLLAAKKMVEGAQELAKQVQGEKQKNMLIGGIIGMVLAGNGKGGVLKGLGI